MVIALGVQPSYFGHDEFAKYAPSLKTLTDAEAIRAKILGAYEFAESAEDPEAAEANRFEVSIPKLGSLYLTHSFDGVVQGLKDFLPSDRPSVAPVFFAFRVMAGMWAIMFALTVWTSRSRSTGKKTHVFDNSLAQRYFSC